MFGNAEANREAKACESLAPVKKKNIYTHTHTHTHIHKQGAYTKRGEGGEGVARLGGVLHFSLSFCAQGEKERK